MNKHVIVIKKDGTKEEFQPSKIIKAVEKSAYRALSPLTNDDKNKILRYVEDYILNYDRDEITVPQMHNLVESALECIKPEVAKSYRDYRNYKTDFVEMINSVYKKAQSIMYIGDKENSNSDSALVSTKRSLIFNQLNKELYQKFFMTTEELQACRDGYIYVHDMSARRDTMNCFRRDTRFITKDGIKSFYDFSDGDSTIVLTHKGNWKPAVVHKYGWQELQKVTFKQGMHTSKEKHVYVTKNHRWILKNGRETTNLSIGDILYEMDDITNIDWDSMTREQRKLWCKGFAKGDGSLIGDRGKFPPYVVTRLCGHKEKYKERFESVGYTVTQPESYDGDYIVHMLDNTDKEIPFLSLNYENMVYYINGLMCADGHRRTSENRKSEFRGIQVTGSLNKYIYDMLNIAGYFVTSMKDLTNQITNYGPRTDLTISYKVSSRLKEKSAWRVVDIEDSTLNPKAEVWCLEVEDDHSFILEGGIPTGNCCLCDVKTILTDGFEMGNIWYNEPTSLDTAFDVIGDIVLSAASQQYGGFTIPRVDELLSKYAALSYNNYYNEKYDDLVKQYKWIVENTSFKFDDEDALYLKYKKEAEEYADKKLYREMEQGFQGWEYKFNTVSSSRGDYPFTTITIGVGTDKFSKLASTVCLRVRAKGQGAKGKKRCVLFPKIVFTYDEKLHGPGQINEDLFEEGIKCSAKAMYPDWLSLNGKTTVAEMWEKYGEIIAPINKPVA